MDRDRLANRFSLFSTFALALGCIIGWGSFVMPGMSFLPRAGVVGSLVGIGIATFFALVICVNYIGLSKSYPEANSSYLLTKQTFGIDHAYFSVWLLILAYLSILWANACAMAYLGRFLFGRFYMDGLHCYTVFGYAVYPMDIVIATATIFLGIALLHGGYRFTFRLILILSVILFAAVLILFVGVLIHSDPAALFRPAFSVTAGFPRGAQILGIAVLAPWLFVGFEAVSHITPETKQPLIRAFIVAGLAILAGMAIYGMLILTVNGDVPEGYRSWEDYASSAAGVRSLADMPVFFSVQKAMGSFGVLLLCLAFFAAVFGSILGYLLAASRTIRIMAEDRVAPRGLAELNRRGVPGKALLLIFLVSLPVMFLGVRIAGFAVDISTLAICIVYAYISLGAFLKCKGMSSYRLWGLLGVLFSTAAFFLLLIPNHLIGISLEKEEYLILSIWCLIGMICYRFALSRDYEFRLGKSMLMWLLMFFLLFYSTNMWTHHQMEEDLLETTDPSEISAILTSNNLYRTIVVILALIILFELFTILLKREKALDQKILEAKERDRVRNSLLSNMSHDIRTPMNAILGFTDLALQDQRDAAKMADYLNKIKLSGTHLLSLINGVLEISRMEGDPPELREELINLPKMLIHLQAIHMERSPEEHRFFALDIHPLTNENVICDRQRLYQMLLHLTPNALHQTAAGDQMTVGLMQLSKAEEGKALYVFFVKDRGTGMTTDLLKYLVDTELPTEKYTKADNQGAELEMIVTREIIHILGGQVEANEDAEGTEIRITLEFKVSEKSLSQEETDYTIDLAGKRALIVDDILINRQIAATMLGVYDMETEEAKDGEEAVAMLSSALPGHYDVVLMDIQMPILNGFEAAKKIRGLPDPVNASVPILAMTENVFDEDREKADESGMNGFVPKSVDRVELIRSLEELLVQKED